MSHIEMLVKQVELVWWSVLRGDKPRGMDRMFDIIRAPAKIDDLVLVGSVHQKTPAEDRIGWLTKIEDAPWQPWDGDEPPINGEDYRRLQALWLHATARSRSMMDGYLAMGFAYGS